MNEPLKASQMINFEKPHNCLSSLVEAYQKFCVIQRKKNQKIYNSFSAGEISEKEYLSANYASMDFSDFMDYLAQQQKEES